MKVCSVPECDRLYGAKGYCDMHYHRVKAHGDPYANFARKKKFYVCTIEECNRKYSANGYCQMHDRRNRLYGSPHIKMNLYRDYLECLIDGCNNKHNSKGYCKVHYQSILKPEIARGAKRRRKARKLKNGFEFYTEKQVLEKYGTNCYLCGEPIDMNAPRSAKTPGWEYGLHIEHVIDMAFGGPDTLDNVRPSHALCNLKKIPNKNGIME